MSPLKNSKLTMLLLVLILATNALAFSSSPSSSSSSSRSVQSPLFASTVGGYSTNTDNARRIPRSRVVQDKILQYLDRKETIVRKEHSRTANDVKALNAELSKIRMRKEDYLQNGIAATTTTTTTTAASFSETALRSAAKAFMWRIIAGSITFCTSLQFSGSVASALSIVGSDFGSKMATMFIGERLMNNSQAGRESGSDAASRSLVKALVWRLFAIANSLTMAIFITKDLSIASKIAGSDALCKTGLMFAYERAWAKVEWGKKYEQDEDADMELTTVAAAP
ncbi:unnamed protein product [Cylindrotheca closterium]|uniref:DUF2061 domain-containing protein n=1 Tax=Cylindrotheca closterium TaxID=2856 RepID=A0AAD2CP84_9STRA|nr:unnamed protein product [Cylindrotheca closterium]